MAKFNVDDVLFTSVDTVDVFTPMFGAFKYRCDEITQFSIKDGQDNTDLVGSKGSIIGVLKRNPNTTISWTAGMVSAKLLADSYGTEVEDGSIQIGWDDSVTITKNKATLTYVPLDGIESVKVGNTTYKVDTTAKAGESVKYTAPVKETSTAGFIEFEASEHPDGTMAIVTYTRKIAEGASVDRRADKVSEKIAARVTGQWEDTCNTVRMWQYDAYIVDPTGTMETTIGDGQTNQSFEGKCIKVRCGANQIIGRLKFFNDDATDYVEV